MHEIINAHAARMTYRHELATAEARMADLPWKAPVRLRAAARADKWRWVMIDGATTAARRVVPRFS